MDMGRLSAPYIATAEKRVAEVVDTEPVQRRCDEDEESIIVSSQLHFLSDESDIQCSCV